MEELAIANPKVPFTVVPIGIWKRVETDGMSNRQMLAVLKCEGIEIGSWAQELILKNDLMPVRETFDFMRCKVGDLGFLTSPTWDELFARVAEIGEPGPLAPTLQLRRQSAGQEQTFIVMDGPKILYFGDTGLGRKLKKFLGSFEVSRSARVNVNIFISFVIGRR